jgi:phosphohistidine phosphatase
VTLFGRLPLRILAGSFWLTRLPQLCRHFRCIALDSFNPGSDITRMRRLFLLRHAKTERAEPGERDRDRRLMPRGRADAPLIGAYMADHGLVPDLALVSPAKRAQETWHLVAACFPRPPQAVSDDRIYNATTDMLIAAVSETGNARTVLVVGHNPGLHDLAVRLTASGDAAARERINEGLPTSGLVVIDLAFDDWATLGARTGRLERFVSPRLINAAAG